MKKNLILTGTLLLTLTLVGCNQNDQNTSKPEENTQQTQQKEVSMNKIQETLLTEEFLKAPAGPAIDAKEFHLFSSVSDKIKEGFVSQAMMNVKFQEIMVVKTSESESESVKTLFEDYLESDTVRLFKDGYGGEENIDAVSNAIINNKGEYTYLIATPNAKEIETKLLELLN